MATEVVEKRRTLVACPFCDRQMGKDLASNSTDNHFVFCVSCGCEGPPAPTEAEAVEAWNRRPRAATPGRADDILATLAALLARVESLEITPLRTHGRSVAVRVQLANGKRRTFAEGPVEAMLAEALEWVEGEGDPLGPLLVAEREKSARLARVLRDAGEVLSLLTAPLQEAAEGRDLTETLTVSADVETIIRAGIVCKRAERLAAASAGDAGDGGPL